MERATSTIVYRLITATAITARRNAVSSFRAILRDFLRGRSHDGGGDHHVRLRRTMLEALRAAQCHWALGERYRSLLRGVW